MDIKDSPFRLWVQKIWIENTEEHLTYGERPYKIQEYWERYKWWLKREFKHKQKAEQNDPRSRSTNAV